MNIGRMRPPAQEEYHDQVERASHTPRWQLWLALFFFFLFLVALANARTLTVINPYSTILYLEVSQSGEDIEKHVCPPAGQVTFLVKDNHDQVAYYRDDIGLQGTRGLLVGVDSRLEFKTDVFAAVYQQPSAPSVWDWPPGTVDVTVTVPGLGEVAVPDWATNPALQCFFMGLAAAAGICLTRAALRWFKRADGTQGEV